jgi:hypothetical protein
MPRRTTNKKPRECGTPLQIQQAKANGEMQNTTTNGTIEIMAKDDDDDSSVDSSKDNANAKDNSGILAYNGNPGAPGGENNIRYAENNNKGNGVSNGNEQE